MKKIIALILTCTIVLSACSNQTIVNSSDAEETLEMTSVQAESLTEESVTMELDSTSEGLVSNQIDVTFKGLDDEALLEYVKDNVYAELVSQLNSEDYLVESIDVQYIPKEYIDALASNSSENKYFGYTADELNSQFQGQKYVFTLGDNGQTVVVPMETLSDDVYVKMMEDVIIGTGVILICTTVSIVAAPAAPAVSVIFAASASSATTFALSSGGLSFVSAAVAKGYETESFELALEAGAEAAGDGFKWGAVSGAIAGGVAQGYDLHAAAKQTNFTMNQYAKIQQETQYPLDVIKQFHTMDEYKAFKNANLKSKMVGNKSALVKTDIDLTRIDSKGRTNLERMKQGLAPKDVNGNSYQLHHVGQKKDGTLAVMTKEEHDNPFIHGFLKNSEAHAPGNNWDNERKAFWKAFAKMVD